MAVRSSQICIYPLSPTYLPLHRYLYYTTLLLSVLYPTPPPLIKGCFAYSLTYSSTAALYAILILALPAPGQIINLDIFSLWAILSSASILLLPLLTWSRSLRSTARPIIRIWGILMLIGTICSFILLLSSQKTASRFVAAGGNGSVDCRAVDLPAKRLRNPETVQMGDYERIFGYLYGLVCFKLSPLVFVPLSFGALSSLITITATVAPSITSSAYQPSSSSSFPGLSSPGLITNPNTSPSPSVLKTAFLSLRALTLYLTPGFLIPVLVINEIYLLKDWPFGLPETEKMYEVGQWGLYAGLGLVSAAAGINAVLGGRGEEVKERESRNQGQGQIQGKDWGWGGREGTIA
jgi:hypothetical protein